MMARKKTLSFRSRIYACNRTESQNHLLQIRGSPYTGYDDASVFLGDRYIDRAAMITSQSTKPIALALSKNNNANDPNAMPPFSRLKRNHVMNKKIVAFIVAIAISTMANGKQAAPIIKTAEPTQAKSLLSITPIYSQLLSFSYPAGFAPAFENSKDNQYIQESIPKGERLERWSQMLTVTGAKDLASNPAITPRVFANNMASGFQQACPSTFSATNIGEFKIDGHDAMFAFLSCGTLSTNGKARSESTLLLVIKGSRDVYTLQWAERGAASKAPIAFGKKWSERMNSLAPVKVCPIIKDEKAPYNSCVGQR
jgi:hypothetical protein